MARSEDSPDGREAVAVRDGFLRIKPANPEFSLEEARRALEAAARLRGSAKLPAVVDVRDASKFDWDARELLAGREASVIASAIALLVDSPGRRAAGEFFLSVKKAELPVRVFTSEREALEWLAQYRQAAE